MYLPIYLGFPGGSDGRECVCNARDQSLIPRSGRLSGEGNGNPLQYSFLENPLDRGAWRATVQGVAKIRTWLTDWTVTKKRVNLLLTNSVISFTHNGNLLKVCLKQVLFDGHKIIWTLDNILSSELLGHLGWISFPPSPRMGSFWAVLKRSPALKLSL